MGSLISRNPRLRNASASRASGSMSRHDSLFTVSPPPPSSCSRQAGCRQPAPAWSGLVGGLGSPGLLLARATHGRATGSYCCCSCCSCCFFLLPQILLIQSSLLPAAHRLRCVAQAHSLHPHPPLQLLARRELPGPVILFGHRAPSTATRLLPPPSAATSCTCKESRRRLHCCTVALLMD